MEAMQDPNYLLLIGILIIVIGFALKMDSIAVIIVSAIVTSLLAGMNIKEILNLLGSSFISARYMSMFFITLPVIGISERYGLREQAVSLIKKLALVTTGRLLILYQFMRQVAGALSLRIGGHPQFVRPLVEPMAQGAAENDKTVPDEIKELIKYASAASENYGNFFGQNLFFASAGVLLVMGTLKEQGFEVTGQSIALFSIPIALVAFILGLIQFSLLDRKINNSVTTKKEVS